MALTCWLLPIKTLAQRTESYAPSNTQTLSEVHDPDPAQNANADTSERSKENEASSKEEVIKSGNEVQNKSVRNTPVSNIQGSYNGRDYSTSEVIQLIKDYSAQYGISANLPLRVAECESGYNQFSKNKHSTASGVFQYLQSTWSHSEAGISQISVFDARANVEMAIKSMASGGISNWTASKSCWK